MFTFAILKYTQQSRVPFRFALSFAEQIVIGVANHIAVFVLERY